MYEGFAIVSPEKGEDFVELASSPKGRVFRKQILHYGDLYYPDVKGGKVKVDEALADSLIRNFQNHVVSSVAVPKADASNQHNEDPDRNIGEVINVLKGKDGIYVDMDIRTDDAEKIGKTLLGTSAMLHLNYLDRRTQQKVGPTLIHNCVTNNAYVPDLGDFEELAALSSGGVDITDQNTVVVLTSANPDSTKEKTMTLDEIIAELKSDHGIDVPALQKKAAETDAALALSSKIQEELVGTGLLKLSNVEETVSADVLIGAVAEAGTKIVELSSKVDGLVEAAEKRDAEADVDALVLSNKILPKEREDYLELRLTSPALFDKMTADKKPVVKLSTESGFETTDDSHKKTVEDELARLTASMEQNTGVKVRK